MLVSTFLLAVAPELDVRTDKVAVTVERASAPPIVSFKVKDAAGRWTPVLYSTDTHNKIFAVKAKRVGQDRIVLDMTSPAGPWRRVYRVTGDRIAVSTEIRLVATKGRKGLILDGYGDTRGAALVQTSLASLPTGPSPMPRFSALGSAFVGLPPAEGQVTSSCSALAGGAYAGFGIWSRPTTIDGRATSGELIVPKTCSWSYVVFPSSDEFDALARANTWSWEAFGHKRLETALPQCMPFSGYTKNAYALKASGEEEEEAVDKKEEEGPWWDAEKDGRKIGAPRGPGFAAWDARGNAAKAAWGMRWWGQYLQIKQWEERAEEYFGLTMSAPMKDGRLPSRFDLEKKTWGYERDLPVLEATSDSTIETLRWVRAWLDKWPDAEAEQRARDWAKTFFATRLQNGGHDPSVAPFAEECASSRSWGPDVKEWADRTLKALGADGRQPGFDLPLQAAVLRAERTQSGRDRDALARAADAVAFGQAVVDDPRLDAPIYGTWTSGQQSLMTSRAGDTALDLMRSGDVLGRRDLFERGVAMLRDLFSRTADPTQSLNGLGPLDGDRVGQTGEGFDPKTGNVHPRRSFETGEGSFLADCARALDEFGGLYVHPNGWSVGIDGCLPEASGSPVSILNLNPRPYAGPHRVDIVKGGERRVSEARRNPGIADIRITWRDGRFVVLATPAVTSPDQRLARPSGTFKSGSWRAKADIGPFGFEAVLPEPRLGVTSLAFQGSVAGKSVSKTKSVQFGPPPRLDAGWMYAVTGLPPVVTGMPGEPEPSLSTGDDGQGHDVGVRTGLVRSVPFVATRCRITMIVRADPDTSVRLVDLTTGQTLHDEKGAVSTMVAWNLEDVRGHLLRIELEDRSGSGSASIASYAVLR